MPGNVKVQGTSPCVNNGRRQPHSPTQVAHSTVAPLIALCLAACATSLEFVLARAAASAPTASTEYSSSSGEVVSGRPTRTALTPALMSPARRLSTAMLESEQARTVGPPSPLSCVAHALRSSTLTAVLPVPGGPFAAQDDVKEMVRSVFYPKNISFVVIPT